MFDRGDAVLYRELWGYAVMTALPMRVVSDSAERTVLHLAPDTAFRAARAPGGGPVADLANWVSQDEEDFASAVAQGHISAETAEHVLADAERMTAAVATAAAPFDERHWLTWQPPAEWTVPRLPADWSRLH